MRGVSRTPCKSGKECGTHAISVGGFDWIRVCEVNRAFRCERRIVTRLDLDEGGAKAEAAGADGGFERVHDDGIEARNGE